MCNQLVYAVIVMVLPTLLQCTTYKIPLLMGNGIKGSPSRNRHSREVSGKEQLQGKPGEGYFMSMALGTPPQTMNVLVDTGSSNFAVATRSHPDIEFFYNTSLSSSFVATSTPVRLPYTQGSWEGFLAEEVISLPALINSTIAVTLSCIEKSSNFFINGSHWQGIMGLAYAEIAKPDASVLPVFDALVAQHKVDNIFTLQLCGTVDLGPETDVSMGGSLVLGGIDETLYSGPIVYVPIKKEWYYEVVITDIKVDGQSLHMDCAQYNSDKTIVDSGTTNLRLPSRVFDAVIALLKSSIKGGFQFHDEFWNGEETDIVCWKEGETPWSMFPYVQLHLAVSANSSFALSLSPQQYLRAVIAADSRSEPQDCFRFAISSSNTGSVLGAMVMEAYYVIFDRSNSRLGFAESTCSLRSYEFRSNMTMPYLHPGTDSSACDYVQRSPGKSSLVIAAYTMGGICGACLIPLLALIIHSQMAKYKARHPIDGSSDQFTNNLLTEEEFANEP